MEINQVEEVQNQEASEIKQSEDHVVSVVENVQQKPSKLKKVFIIIGIIILVILALGTYFYFSVVKPGLAIDEEARTYAKNVSNKLLIDWDYQDYKASTSPDLQDALSKKEEENIKLFAAFKEKLGALKSIDGDFVGQVTQSSIASVKTDKAGVENATSGHYEANAVFEKGDGKIKFDLIKKNGEWSIYKMIILSNNLITN